MEISFITIFMPISIAIGYVNTANILSRAMCTKLLDDGHFWHRWYDPAYKICCGQRLSQRTTNVACCEKAQELYFTDKQICCDGQILNKTVSKQTKKWEISCDHGNPDCIETMCCGKKLVLKEDNVFCCDGKEITLTEDQVQNKDFLKCCEKNVYNTHTEMCCQGVFPRGKNIGCCDGDIFNKKKYMCVQDRKIKRTEGFCGDVLYDRMENTCCGDQLIENVAELLKAGNNHVQNPNAQCCGSFIINKNESCCEERLYGYPTHSIPKQFDLGCCGSGSYNKKTQFCLNGKPVNRSAEQAVCGNVIIDTSIQSCCANKLPYNNASEQCCEGTSYCVINKNEKCCNGLRMKDNEVCCENIKPCKKSDVEDDDCCYDRDRDNAQTYKKGRSACYAGQIVPLPEGASPCGLNDYVKPNEHFCCSEKKYKHGDGQCCEGVYSKISPKEGRCCITDNKAYRFDDMTNPCIKKCNKREWYDISFELCCGGKKFNYTGNNYCCGASAINPNRMSCCGEQFPYRRSSRRDCCYDTQLYNPKYSTCASDGKVEFKGDLEGLSDVQRLCQPLSFKLFDGAIQQACMRKYAISGRIARIDRPKYQKDEIQLRILLRSVKTLTATKVPNRVTFNIHIASDKCQVDHLKRLSRVIVLFDDEFRGKNVKISKDSPFFMSVRTFQRYYSLTKAISKNLCKIFL